MRRFLIVAVLVAAMVLAMAAPALATVNPGQHNGWDFTTPQMTPPGQANGWIVDDTHNPPGNRNGWVPCR